MLIWLNYRHLFVTILLRSWFPRSPDSSVCALPNHSIPACGATDVWFCIYSWCKSLKGLQWILTSLIAAVSIAAGVGSNTAIYRRMTAFQMFFNESLEIAAIVLNAALNQEIKKRYEPLLFIYILTCLSSIVGLWQHSEGCFRHFCLLIAHRHPLRRKGPWGYILL